MLDSGDALNGELGLGLLTKGGIQVEAMNLMGYDAMALGSGDFSIGWDELGKRMSEADFPFLSANLVLTATGEMVGEPYVIKDLTPEHRVAIIGLTDPYVSDLLAAVHQRPVGVLDPIETARRYVDEVSGQADIVIVLSHLGYDQDYALAQAVPEIDLIVGGKSGHVFDPPTRPYPAGPVIAQAGQLGQRLGEVRLDLDADGNVIGWDGHPITLGAESPHRSADDRSVAKLRDFLGRNTDTVVLRRAVLRAGPQDIR